MKRGLKMCTIEKIRVKGSRPGRITKSKAVRNLFGTTPNDHDSWLKQELEQAFLQDRKKMESLGLDPDTGMPAENNTSRWEWTAVDENSCPKIYRSKDILSGFVNLSTNSSTSIVFSSENNRLLDTVARNNIVCSTTTTSTNTSTVNQDASQTPKQYKQTTITDFMPQRRHRVGLLRDQLSPIFRSSSSRQKNLETSVQNSAINTQDSTTVTEAQ